MLHGLIVIHGYHSLLPKIQPIALSIQQYSSDVTFRIFVKIEFTILIKTRMASTGIYRESTTIHRFCRQTGQLKHRFMKRVSHLMLYIIGQYEEGINACTTGYLVMFHQRRHPWLNGRSIALQNPDGSNTLFQVHAYTRAYSRYPYQPTRL